MAGVFALAACGRVGFDNQPVGGDADAGLTEDAALAIDAGPPVDASPPPADPTGFYAVDPPVVYTCAAGLVDLDISALDVVMNGATVEVQGSPCVQSGSYDPASGDLATTCTLAGTCDETYALTGSFVSGTRFEGVFTATFVGTCLNCANQVISVVLE